MINPTKKPFEIYRAPDGWRWRLKSPNGRIIADGSEAYASRSGAVRAVARLKQLVKCL